MHLRNRDPATRGFLFLSLQIRIDLNYTGNEPIGHDLKPEIRKSPRNGISGRTLFLLVSFLAPLIGDDAWAEDLLASLATQTSLTDTRDGPKAQLKTYGVQPDVWVTQICQGIMAGSPPTNTACGGKIDAFLRIDAEKAGLWKGFHVFTQFEQYTGLTINNITGTLLPVSAIQAFVQQRYYHNTLTLFVRQELNEHLSISAGKVNMLTLAARTPILGGGGWETFLNRAFAIPKTGIGITAPGTLADRVIVAPTYTLGALVDLKTHVGDFTFAVADPRNAEDPRVIQNPFERGVALTAGYTLPLKLADLQGYHSLRAAYSNARGFDLDDFNGLRARLSSGQTLTKKGYWFASYALQQFLMQSENDPSVGWGLFTNVSISDGNPNPVKWSLLVGIAGNNLLKGRERDKWGIGYYHYGLSQLLINGLQSANIPRRSEGGIECFYNFAITPWVQLSADLQIIDPWKVEKTRETVGAIRLFTKL